MEGIVKRIYLFALLALIWSGYSFGIEGGVFKDDFEGPAVITGFQAEPATIAAGQSTTISWTTEHASSCTASNGAGEWDSQTIQLTDGNAQIVIPAVATYTFTLTCTGVTGDPAVAETMVTVIPAAAITSFSATPETIVESGSATISWTTENATSCTPSGGTGGWSSTVIELPDNNVQLEISTPGEHTFTLTCQGEAGDQVVANAMVSVILPVAITSFIATPDTINAGESTTISWITENAVSCTPSAGASGWSLTTIDLPDGTIDIPIASEDVVTFILTCEGAAGVPAVAEVMVTVNAATPLCDVPLIGETYSWIDTWGSEFPGPVYGNEYGIVFRSGYLAIEFNTGVAVDNGLIVTISTPLTSGTRLGSVSECAGDFEVASECQHTWGTGGGITWATDGTAGACQLTPNTTYYFNLTFTDGLDLFSTTCDKSPCWARMQYTNMAE